MIRFSAFSLKLALGAAVALAAISLSPGSAQAFVVNVGGMQYDVTTFTGTYDANTSKFATAANNGVMPWWGDSSLAAAFALQVGASLGLPNLSGTGGPFFGWLTDPDRSLSYYRWVGGTVANRTILKSANQRTWAQATLYTPPAAPVPAPLPLFGAAAAFGFSRKLRKRIKLAPGPLGSALPRA